MPGQSAHLLVSSSWHKQAAALYHELPLMCMLLQVPY
jgi:hypothetical protein